MAILNSARKFAGGFVAGVGNALRLPEMNISERIAGKVSAGFTPPQVQGAKSPVIPKGVPLAQPGGGGGFPGGNAGAGSVVGGSSGGGYQQYMQQEPGYDAPDFDSIINPIISQLDSEIGGLQGQLPGQVEDIRKQGANKVAAAQQEFEGQQTQLTRRGEEQTRLGESAADEARRQYAEIQQGLQSRYGGTTGTGAFAGELAGRETTRAISNVRTTLATNLQKIEDTRQQLREVGRIAIQDLQDKTEAQVNDAKSNLEAQLNEIRRLKGELVSRKAEMANQAFSAYQQTLQQVRSNNAAFAQNLYLKQVEAENQLNLAKSRGSSALESLTFGTYDIGGVQTPVAIGNKTGAARPITGLQPGGRLSKMGTGSAEDEEAAFTF